jgi:hypothetical protein
MKDVATWLPEGLEIARLLPRLGDERGEKPGSHPDGVTGIREPSTCRSSWSPLAKVSVWRQTLPKIHDERRRE